eukprot:7806761-Prorocentrum_lima.AAC.1
MVIGRCRGDNGGKTDADVRVGVVGDLRISEEIATAAAVLLAGAMVIDARGKVIHRQCRVQVCGGAG